MQELDPTTPWLALGGGLLFGLTNSLHCVGMCGPLVAATHGGIGAGVGYHAARVFGYATIGAIAGFVGDALGIDAIRPGGATFALTLAAVMVLGVFGISGRIGKIRWIQPLIGKVTRFAAELPPTTRGVALGAVTPLLPCGLLYAAVAIAVATGSAAGGIAAMAGFGLAVVPALSLAQWNFGWIRSRFGVHGTRRFAQATILIAAAALVWRAGWEIAQGPTGCCSHAG